MKLMGDIILCSECRWGLNGDRHCTLSSRNIKNGGCFRGRLIRMQEPVKEAKTKEKICFVMPDSLPQGCVEDGIMTITIPALPPSKNIYMRLHWRSQQERFFKPWEQMMGLVHWHTGFTPFRGQVDVEIKLHFPDERPRDSLNYVCFPPLVDYLWRNGLIFDDSAKVCRITIVEPVVDSTSQTILRIRERREG